MGVPAISLCITLGSVLAGANPPEVIAVPPAVEGRPARDSLAAWKTIKTELTRAKKRMGVSTKLQRKRRHFLVGPVRERARDCGFNVPCLVEVGATLGADILVAGLVEASQVTLVAIDVGAGRQIAEAASSRSQAQTSTKRKARMAARALFRALGKRDQIAAADPASPAPAADVLSERIDDDDPPAVAAAPVDSDAGPFGAERTPESPSSFDVDQPGVGSSNPTDEVRPLSPTEGRLEIPRDQLVRVTAVRVDGEPVAFSSDGAIRWTGPAGDHSLVAVRLDGERLRRNVVVEPGSTRRIVLEFPSRSSPSASAASPSVTSAPPPRPMEESNDSVTGTWWFWTSVGAAVLVGAGTATALAVGSQGGPRFSGGTGTIQGSY